MKCVFIGTMAITNEQCTQYYVIESELVNTAKAIFF